MPRLHFVTSNENKVSELREILPDLIQVKLDLPEIQAVRSRDVIHAKLLEARKHLQDVHIVVEDSALHLTCLNGFPGALVKWMHTCVGSAGIYDVCARMGDAAAQAVATLGYLSADGEAAHFFEASLEGTIVAPRGHLGFGWDDIFMPTGQDRTLAELDPHYARAIKMRRGAAELLRDHLDCQSRVLIDKEG